MLSALSKLSYPILATTPIDLTQYRLVIREKHKQAVKVYCQNTAGQIVEIALEEPLGLAALIGIEALRIRAVGTFTLILKPDKDTSTIELILSIEDAQRKIVSEPVSVTWGVQRSWTLPQALIGPKLIAVTVFLISLRFLVSPTTNNSEDDKASEKSADSFYATYAVASCIGKHTKSSSMGAKPSSQEEEERLIITFIRPEDILQRLIKMKGEQDAKQQLKMLKQLMNTKNAEKRIEK